MSENELLLAFQKRISLNATDTEIIKKLWEYFQQDNQMKLKKTGKILKNKLPFILPAIEAHIERFPEDGSTGRPVQSLKQILRDLNITDFETVFRKFCKRETIYGFNDLQVKKMLNEILINQ